MSGGEAWVEVPTREKPPQGTVQRPVPVLQETPSPQVRDKQGRTGKSDGNASFLRAARAGNLDKVLEYLKGSTDINTSNANGLNALHLAAKEGHVNIVTELLKRGANVDAATKKGNTALHIASLAGQEEIVKILVQQGAKVNVQSQNGFTPLYMAAQENHAEVVQFLLDNGASQSLATDDGFTPLAVALQQGHDKVVTVLLENDTRGRVKLPALHIAAKKDDVKAASLLLQNEHNPDGTSKGGSLVNDTTKSGFTPLHIASHYGNVNVGNLLVEKGADINFKARNSITPLHVASKWGRGNMVTLLLDSKANIDARTRDGLTALHCAARSGHDQVVDLLLERGAPVGAKTKNGLSPLHMSAQGDHVDCARLLLSHKAPINDVTVDYLTPLHVAAHCGNVRTAKLLLDRKCEVNARALNGFTPLHIACKKNRIKVVELLLKYGANIEATTESGLTPLHVSAFMGHMNIVIYLIQHGANPDFATVRGETALHLAARANQTDIIRILLRNGAAVDAKAREQQTPLHIAARLGNVDNVALLLQHGANPDATTKDLYTPLHIAAKEGHEEVSAVLLEHRASLNLTTKKGFTPLHIAAKYGQIKVAKLLLQKGANPDIQGANGLTPLHVATHYNNVNVAALLLEHKASPHATAKNGYTPLHIAAKKNQMDIATTLLEFGAKPNAESKSGFTSLHLASQEGHTDMVSLLLERGAEVNCRAKNGLTPMHLAAQEDKVPVAEVLVKYKSEIDLQTKAGYTPLHTACHFGQINMIRFLLEHGASVDAKTKLGYTPLHQAAQQGHVLVINLLLKHKANPDAISNNGQTPLSIAQRLGYISVVEILKNITTVQAAPPGSQDEKYKVHSPETMQETLVTDSEDEGGDDTILGDRSYMSSEDMKFLADDSISPGGRDEFGSFHGRDSTLSSGMGEELTLLREDTIPMTPTTPYPVFQPEDRGLPPPYAMILETSMMSQGQDHALHPDYDTANGDVDILEVKHDDSDLQPSPSSPEGPIPMEEEKLEARAVTAVHAGRPAEDAQIYSSYSGMSFSSSFDPDNVAVDRQPLFSGFLVSFMVDARGGAMRGCRHSGVRIIIPPGHASMPTRVTCKLVKKEKLTHPPPLMEGEALASRILEMGPVSAKFLGPVVIEVPHFASLRGKEREIVVLRSDNGDHWREHTIDATDEAIQEALHGSFEDLESAEDIYHSRVTRILTTDFPQYFAIVTRIRQETSTIGTDGGMISSTVVPQVQAVFPDGALTKKIKVGLQAQPVQPELVSKMLGNRVAVSPIVTVEPRRRKFHKPITLTIPVPKAAQKGMINQYGGETPTLRLLCSITGGVSPAQWEDITGSTPLKFINDCVSFTTTVSARFWLMDCQNINEAAKMATELYREAMAVPFMAKFVVFAKRHDHQESRLRVFCMTDDKMDKTLEGQEHFAEVARSRDVEVLDGKPQYVEMAGNLVPVTKSGEQLNVNFHAFRENRLPFNVRTRDLNQEPVGRIAFMKEPKVARGEAPQTPICNLNIKLPDVAKGDSTIDLDSDAAMQLRQQYDILRGAPGEEKISRAELRLTDIGDQLQGDWVILARELQFTEEEITTIQTEYTYPSEQAQAMLQQWVDKNGSKATGNELEVALRNIGREDVIDKCKKDQEDVSDAVERAVAKVHIDQAGFDAFKEELGPSRGSSIPRGVSLDVSYDEQDLAKDSEISEPSMERKDSQKKKPDTQEEELLVASFDDRRGVIKSPTIEEEDAEARRRAEAFVALARQMEGEVEIDYAVESPEAEPAIEEEISENKRDPTQIEDFIEKMEALKEEGMDDRVSVSSEEETREPKTVVEEQVTVKSVKEAHAAPAGQTFEDWAQQTPADEVVREAAQPDHDTFEDWVEKKRLDDSADLHEIAAGTEIVPEIVRDIIEGDIEPKSTVDESEETLEDGTIVKRRVEVIDHVKPVTERITEGDKVTENVTYVSMGSEVVEELTELLPGADPDDMTNAETSVEEYEESMPDGTWQKKRIVKTRIEPPPPRSADLSPDEGKAVDAGLVEALASEPPTGEYDATELIHEPVQEPSEVDLGIIRRPSEPPEEVMQVSKDTITEEYQEVPITGPELDRVEIEPPEGVQEPPDKSGIAVDHQQEVVVVETQTLPPRAQPPDELDMDEEEQKTSGTTPEVMAVPSPEIPQELMADIVADEVVLEADKEHFVEKTPKQASPEQSPGVDSKAAPEETLEECFATADYEAGDQLTPDVVVQEKEDVAVDRTEMSVEEIRTTLDDLDQVTETDISRVEADVVAAEKPFKDEDKTEPEDQAKVSIPPVDQETPSEEPVTEEVTEEKKVSTLERGKSYEITEFTEEELKETGPPKDEEEPTSPRASLVVDKDQVVISDKEEPESDTQQLRTTEVTEVETYTTEVLKASQVEETAQLDQDDKSPIEDKAVVDEFKETEPPLEDETISASEEMAVETTEESQEVITKPPEEQRDLYVSAEEPPRDQEATVDEGPLEEFRDSDIGSPTSPKEEMVAPVGFVKTEPDVDQVAIERVQETTSPTFDQPLTPDRDSLAIERVETILADALTEESTSIQEKPDDTGVVLDKTEPEDDHVQSEEKVEKPSDQVTDASISEKPDDSGVVSDKTQPEDDHVRSEEEEEKPSDQETDVNISKKLDYTGAVLVKTVPDDVHLRASEEEEKMSDQGTDALVTEAEREQTTIPQDEVVTESDDKAQTQEYETVIKTTEDVVVEAKEVPTATEPNIQLLESIEIPDNAKVEDYIETAPDGTRFIRRVITQYTDAYIIKTVIICTHDGKISKETITEPIDDIPKTSHISEPVVDQQVVETEAPVQQVIEETDIDVVSAEKPTDEDMFYDTEAPEEKIQEPIDDIPAEVVEKVPTTEKDYEPENVDEFDETLPDGTVVHKKIITYRQDNIIIRTTITTMPDGSTRTDTVTEHLAGPKADEPTAEEIAVAAALAEAAYEPSDGTSSPEEAPADVIPAGEDVDEVEETLPDGTVIKRRIIKRRVKVITKKIRKIGPDGQVTEEVVTEEVPVDADGNELSPAAVTMDDQTEDDQDEAGVRVYADTIRGDPQTETDVQEFEETLPDGTVVKRRVVKTKQKQTVVKRFIMEGPEGALPTTDEEAHRLLSEQAPGELEPEMKLYVDRIEGEPRETSDVQEFEETLPDGTVVKRRVITTKQQQLITEHKLLEGADEIPGFTDMIPPHPSEEEQAIQPATAQVDQSAVAAGEMAEGGDQDDMQETRYGKGGHEKASS